MELKPFNGFVVIEVIKDTNTEGDYALPESVAEKPAKGKVIAVVKGDDLRLGETVVFKRYSGQDVRHEGKDLKLVKIEDLMGYFE